MPPDLYTDFLDLPPGPRPPNHYAILLLPLFEPDPKVIHDAVLDQNAKLRRWALHPDKATRDRVQDMLNELGRADFILGDPKTKADYDRKLAAELGVPLPAPPAPAPPPRPAPEAAAPPPTCPACGAPTRPESRFCPACGEDLREEEEPEELPREGEESLPATAGLRGIPLRQAAIVAGAAAAVLILGILVIGALRGPGGSPPRDSMLAEARKAWAAALADAPADLLAKHVPEEWSTARQKAEEAETRANAGATDEALNLFREATQALGKAKAPALDRAEGPARFAQAIVAARAALVKKAYDDAAGEVQAARLALPSAAIPPDLLAAIQPCLTVIADLDGTEFKGALVSLNGIRQKQSTPATFGLERRKSYNIEVTIPDQPGKRFAKAAKTLIADWHGPQTFRAAISEAPPFEVYTAWPFDAGEAKRRQEETARGLGVKVEEEVDLGRGVKLTLVLIPAGEFMMGSPAGEEGRDAHENLHRVTIAKPFWIGKHEVTQEQWEALMVTDPSWFKGAKNPVENLLWQETQGFLKELRGQVGGAPFTLPTEDQWEYACRAGSAERFCFGDADQQLGQYAWHKNNSQGTTHPVGQKAPNAWGLHDMHGNVPEWCSSPYLRNSYDGSETKGAEAEGALRVVRGGCVQYDPGRCRSAYRAAIAISLQRYAFGFRVVRSARASEQVASPRPVLLPPDVAGPILARVEKAVAAKDAAEAKNALDQLKKADPAHARLAELEAQVAAIAPKPAPATQVYTAWPFDPAEAKRRQEETAKALGVKVEEELDLGGGIKLTLVLIPAGQFTLGSPPTEAERYGNEDPREVTIGRAFWIGKFEVTQEQWEVRMGTRPSRFEGANCPVGGVSWNDVQEFLAQVNGAAPGAGFALPSEAQWEYACRAGSTARFCFGDGDQGLGDYAWYNWNAKGTAQPVGGKKANAWGLHDLHGNVREWCASPAVVDYDGREQKGAETPAGVRVLRGGSWRDNRRECRSAFRDKAVPTEMGATTGFRLVCSAGGVPKVAPLPPASLARVFAARIENAVAAKDHRAAQTTLEELRTSDPQNARLPELEARVHSIAPKPIQVYSGWPFDAEQAKLRQVWTAQVLGEKAESLVDLGKGVTLELVLIPAGEFTMGSPPKEKGRLSEEDLHRVTISTPFWMGKYEVTQEQWVAVMGDNPSNIKGAKNPVEMVSWDAVQGFLKKLNWLVPTGGFALPTEAEWEYACRAGTSTGFCFGDDDGRLGEYAWCKANSKKRTHTVGLMKGNAWGLYDMHGNVSEWCASPYVETYDGNEEKDATAKGPSRICRGGSLAYVPRSLRSAARHRWPCAEWAWCIGFRVVRSVSARQGGAQPAPSEAAVPMAGQVEEAVAAKDYPEAKAVLGELKKAAPTYARLPELEAKVAALAPKGEFQVYKTWPFSAAEAKRRQEETANALGVRIEEDMDLPGGVKLALVLIPAGEFMMGSPQDENGRRRDERLHRVKISKPFWMGRYEVTVEQWRTVMHDADRPRGGDRTPFDGTLWKEVQTFLQKLNRGKGGGKFALPTEAQWEYACRAGTNTRFCYGDGEEALGEHAWWSENSKKDKGFHSHQPVGLKSANAWGLYDMHGNVCEWCASPYAEDYDGNEQKGAEAKGESRVVRGGDYHSDAQALRSASRDKVTDDRRHPVGFRVVRSVPGY